MSIMATLIPTDIHEIKYDGERELAINLRENLPDSWVIIHGRTFLADNDNGSTSFGETDFLIINPKQGLLVVETKSGDLQYDATDNYWYHINHNGKKQKLKSRDPFSQVSGNMFKIKNLILQKYPHAFGDAGIGYAIALPDSTYDGTLPPDLRKELVLTEHDCKPMNIRKSIENAFAVFDTPTVYISDSWIQQILDVLYPIYRIMPLNYRKYENFEHKIHRLTQTQTRLLDSAKNFRRASFKGSAGTGKTMLAVAKAQIDARNGKRVLLLCYNAALKTWLQRSYETHYDTGSIKFDTYHGIVQELADKHSEELARKYGRTWNTSLPNFWNIVVADILYELCYDIVLDEEKYDSIIIDEGQDFRSNWWDGIELLLRNPASEQCLYIFYDPKQNLFSEQVTLPTSITIPPFELSMNCRNTIKISDHVASIIGTTAETHPDAPLGNNPNIIRVNNVGDGVSKAIDLAQQLHKEGFQNKQVCILLYGVPENEERRIVKIDGFTDDVSHWWDNQSMLVCSIGRFKGLESDHIIIVEDKVNDSNKRNHPEDINSMRYVARSRAKFTLTIIQTPNAR